MERQHGSEEEERWQKEQGRPQRLGAEGSSHTRAEQGGESGSTEETQIIRLKANETEKPALSPAFLHLPA